MCRVPSAAWVDARRRITWVGSMKIDRRELARRYASLSNEALLSPDRGDASSAGKELNVMVPLALAMHATAVLDRDLFNEEYEAEWRAHLKMRSDKNLSMLNPGIFCAGLQDRPARIMKAYADEIAARNMQA